MCATLSMAYLLCSLGTPQVGQPSRLHAGRLLVRCVQLGAAAGPAPVADAGPHEARLLSDASLPLVSVRIVSVSILFARANLFLFSRPLLPFVPIILLQFSYTLGEVVARRWRRR